MPQITVSMESVAERVACGQGSSEDHEIMAHHEAQTRRPLSHGRYRDEDFVDLPEEDFMQPFSDEDLLP